MHHAHMGHSGKLHARGGARRAVAAAHGRRLRTRHVLASPPRAPTLRCKALSTTPSPHHGPPCRPARRPHGRPAGWRAAGSAALPEPEGAVRGASAEARREPRAAAAAAAAATRPRRHTAALGVQGTPMRLARKPHIAFSARRPRRCIAALVCKRWEQLVSSPQLLRRVDIALWPAGQPPDPVATRPRLNALCCWLCRPGQAAMIESFTLTAGSVCSGRTHA